MTKKPHQLSLQSGNLTLPVFLPDATFGVVRAVDSNDLDECGVKAVVMNTFHLMQKPGSSTIQSLGGLHRMSGWEKPIITDSGGFQAYSLIHQNPRNGSLSDQGILFKPEGSQRKFQLTPEKTIQLQIAYDADIVICLDDCTHVGADLAVQRISVKRTIDWARRCKKEYQRILDGKKPANAPPPRIFAVIQGGGIEALRRECADALLEIGFDGYGFGGWPLDGKGNLLEDILAYTRSLVPPEYPMHALGVGHPENVLACHRLGYDLFDSAMPTRDARHSRLYAFTSDGMDENAGLHGDWVKYVYIEDDKHIKSDKSISPHCDCPVCSKYSLGYLHHLYKLGDHLYFRLATMHNLRFMTQLIERMQKTRS